MKTFRLRASWVVFLVLMLVLALAQSGCTSRSGSQEYVPGNGWRPV